MFVYIQVLSLLMIVALLTLYVSYILKSEIKSSFEVSTSRAVHVYLITGVSLVFLMQYVRNGHFLVFEYFYALGGSYIWHLLLFAAFQNFPKMPFAQKFTSLSIQTFVISLLSLIAGNLWHISSHPLTYFLYAFGVIVVISNAIHFQLTKYSRNNEVFILFFLLFFLYDIVGVFVSKHIPLLLDSSSSLPLSIPIPTGGGTFARIGLGDFIANTVFGLVISKRIWHYWTLVVFEFGVIVVMILGLYIPVVPMMMVLSPLYVATLYAQRVSLRNASS